MNRLKLKASHPQIGTIEFIVNHDDYARPAVRALLNGDFHEPDTHEIFADIGKNFGGRVVHAGAYFGDMLYTLSKNFGGVYAFEPVLNNYILAKENAANWELNNVYLFNAGLSDELKIAPIFVNGGGSSFKLSPNRVSEKTTQFPLDSLSIWYGVTLLHLDVEGWENFALLGAKESIQRDWPIIAIEGNTPEVREFLENYTYMEMFKTRHLHFWASSNEHRKFLNKYVDKYNPK